MHNNFFIYLDYEQKTIGDKDFIVIYVLEFYKKQVFKIYKKHNDDLINKLELLDKLDKFVGYQNINDNICFDIKRDGKISLDIKL